MDSDSQQAQVVLATFPDIECARKISALLVEANLAACVNLLPHAESIYRWQGKVERESEVMAVIKTTSTCVKKLESTLIEAHPYEVPECLVLHVAGGSEAYLKWVDQMCTSK